MRIIAGSARGRRIEAPEGLDTRPTLDRVKEALFGSIQFDLPGSLVLDLFSGSGNQGFEAVSRGAAHAFLNDASPVCAALIRRNAASVGLSGSVTVTQLDYRAAIDRYAQEGRRFHIAFLDAPYESGLAQDAAERLFRTGRMAENGFIVLEHSTALPPRAAEGLMRIRRTRNYGACGYTIFERDAAQ